MTGLRSSKQFSLGFKLQVVEEASRGELSLKELSEKFGIRGHSTISKWIRELECKTSILSTPNDYELRKESSWVQVRSYIRNKACNRESKTSA